MITAMKAITIAVKANKQPNFNLSRNWDNKKKA